MKAHHVAAFGCALLNHHGGLYPLRSIAAELIRRGVELRPPSVNQSIEDCSLEDEAVRVGLGKIRGLTGQRIGILVETRESGAFRDVDDLVRRVRPSRRELESLLFCGACDDLPPLSAAEYPFAQQSVLERYDQGKAATQRTYIPVQLPPGDEADVLPRYRSLVRIQNELLYLQMHVHSHPMAVLREEATRFGCLDLRGAERASGSAVRIAGVVAASMRVLTGGGLMQFVTLEDEVGTLEAVLLPPTYRRLGNRVTSLGPFIVSGKSVEEQGDVHLVVTRIDPFFERDRIYPASTLN